MSNKISDYLHANGRAPKYVWEARKNGIVIGVECPPGAQDDTPFSAIGFSYRPRSGRNPDDVHTFVNDTGETVQFTARSLDEGVFPHLDIDIGPGDAVVWCHCRKQGFEMQGDGNINFGKELFHFETMIFGRETPTGEIKIAQIWPNGETQGFETYADAMNAL